MDGYLSNHVPARNINNLFSTVNPVQIYVTPFLRVCQSMNQQAHAHTDTDTHTHTHTQTNTVFNFLFYWSGYLFPHILLLSYRIPSHSVCYLAMHIMVQRLCSGYIISDWFNLWWNFSKCIASCCCYAEVKCLMVLIVSGTVYFIQLVLVTAIMMWLLAPNRTELKETVSAVELI